MKSTTNTESEVWLARYAAEHGLEGGDDHQPALGGSAEPDFRLRRGGCAAIVEVKEFKTSFLDQALRDVGPRSTVTLDPEDELTTIRSKLNKAARKRLRPYRDRGEALVVCLANPRAVRIDLGFDDIQTAMHGDPGYVLTIDPATGGAVDEGRFEYGRNGAFADHHRYVSAVMTLHRGTLAAEAIEHWHTDHRDLWEAIAEPRERMEAYLAARDEKALEAAGATEGDFYFVRVYESKWVALGEAVPVPRDLFNGPRDEVWTVDLATGRPLRVHPAEY